MGQVKMRPLWGAVAVGGALVAATLGAAPAQAAVDLDVCNSGVSAVLHGSPTSCPFADVVRSAWYTQGGASVVRAYSPVTGGTYTMTCWGNVQVTLHPSYITRDAIECRNDTGADVWFW